jgi:hypothetical protein
MEEALLGRLLLATLAFRPNDDADFRPIERDGLTARLLRGLETEARRGTRRAGRVFPRLAETRLAVLPLARRFGPASTSGAPAHAASTLTIRILAAIRRPCFMTWPPAARKRTKRINRLDINYLTVLINTLRIGNPQIEKRFSADSD